MSKLILDPKKAVRARVRDLHKAVWSLFGDHPDRRRDFLFRALDDWTFLVVSERKPVDSEGLWTIMSKEYKPVLRAGDRLFFHLRANPVRKTRDARGRQVRHDVVQDARKRLMAGGASPDDLPGRAALAVEEGGKWLAARQEALGVELDEDQLTADGYAVNEVAKGDGRVMRWSVLDLKGFCTVRDPDRLQQALFHGVGPAKAYGCGLLTVARG